MRKICLCCILIVIGTMLWADSIPVLDYRRNALNTMLIYHPEDEFGYSIYEAFAALPIPDKYDDHSVSWRVVDNSTIYGVQPRDSGLYKATYGHALTALEISRNAQYIEDLLNAHQMGNRLVAKWFDLQGDSIDNAVFGTSLIAARGQYNATDVDVAIASHTTRGLATLSDAGEELIGQTFILVNDITYVTAEQEAMAAKISMAVLGGILDALVGGSDGQQLAEAAGQIADSFTGFKVKTHSYLYQLVWNDSVANVFYKYYYTSMPAPEKVNAFLQDDSLFQVRYVAHEYEFDKKSILKGKYERQELIKTICARSMDKNIVALAKKYEDFKVKTPVYEVLYSEKGRAEGYAAKIGMKEGITEKSRFQVVQRVINPNTGKTTYRYVATVRPKKGQIWDNRYNAVKEQGKGTDLSYTTFQKVSGGTILPGMLLVEGKYRKVDKSLETQ